MVEILTCKKCNKIFNYVAGQRDVCPKCKKILDDILVDVKKYIREHDRCNISEVAKEFDYITYKKLF